MIVIVLPDLPEEDRLLTRARQGDEQAVMQIYERYFPPIFQFIRLRVDDPALAEDLAADVFVRLIRALRGRNAPTFSLRGWLFRAARNLLSTHYGRDRRMTQAALEEWMPAPSDDEPEIQFMRSLDLQRVRRALALLTAEQQEVLILRFGQMLSLEETSDIMGKSVASVKSLQFRAVNALRERLGILRAEAANG